MAYGCAGLCTDFESRPKKCKITAKIGKKLKKILGHKTLPWTNLCQFDPKFQNFAICVTPYITNTNIKNKIKIQKKFIARGFTTVCWHQQPQLGWRHQP
jgi:hypothetical protein